MERIHESVVFGVNRLAMPTLEIRHLTVYRYRKPVQFGEHRMMFRPRESFDQHVLSHTLDIEPEPCRLRYLQDVFGNSVGVAEFDRPSERLSFESRVVLQHHPSSPLVDAEETFAPGGAAFPFAYAAEDMPDLLRSIERHFADPARTVEAFSRRFLRWNGPTPIADLLAEMTRAIHAEFTYAKRFDGRTQSPAETLELGTGTCRDFAVLMMEAARSLGLAARFLSGYVYSPTADGAVVRSDTKRGGGHTHAWLQVYLPSSGWVEFDPTNGIIGNRDLVRVAVARDPQQAVPLSGVWHGDPSDFLDLTVEVDVLDRTPARLAA
jgi:transglutaminase-like putative cysteine protease